MPEKLNHLLTESRSHKNKALKMTWMRVGNTAMKMKVASILRNGAISRPLKLATHHKMRTMIRLVANKNNQRNIKTPRKINPITLSAFNRLSRRPIKVTLPQNDCIPNSLEAGCSRSNFSHT